MRQSDALDKIAPALVEARKGVGPIHKDARNPHFGNNFASLSSIAEAVIPALLGQGILVIQGGDGSDDTGVVVVTRLQHSSGQWIESEVRMPLEKSSAQGAGSAITYGRRYGLAAALGLVADEDDDGASAAQPPKRAPVERKQPDKRDPVIKEIAAFIRSHPGSEDDAAAIAKRLGVKSLKELPIEDLVAALSELREVAG